MAQLARRLTAWSLSSRLSSSASITGVSRGKSKDKAPAANRGKNPQVARASPGQGFKYLPHATEMESNLSKGELVVCTGGAGGFMEAANRGAADVPGGRSIGMGISLPFESGLNPYVTPELAFEYHYFFTRKLCMAFHMQALVVAPHVLDTTSCMVHISPAAQSLYVLRPRRSRRPQMVAPRVVVSGSTKGRARPSTSSDRSL